MACARLALVAALVALAATASASSGALGVASEPIAFGGRVLCPYVRYPERCAGPGYNGAIFTIARPGAPARRITDRRFDDSRPSWSPDRQRIAFVRSRAPGTGFQVWLMNADGSGARQLTRGEVDTEPAWSPDGRWIAFRGGTRTFDVFVVRPDGTGLRNVTRSPAGFGALAPTWSPDGRRIAFQRRAPRAAGTGIYAIGIDGRGLRRLARGSSPDWSPDGARIAYLDEASSHVYTVAPSGSGKRRITLGGPWAAPTWSPDSRRLAAAFDERRLAVLRLDGSVARWLTQRRPGFAIDGLDW